MKKVAFCFIWIGLMACSTSSFAYYNSGFIEAFSDDCNLDVRTGRFIARDGFFIAVTATAAIDFYSCSPAKYPRAYASIIFEDSSERIVEVALTGPGSDDYLTANTRPADGACAVFAQAFGFNGTAYALLAY